MLEVGLRLSNHTRNFLHPLTQIWNAVFCRRKIPRDQKIKAVGKTLHINKRIRFRLLEFLRSEDLVIDVLLEDPKIDVVRTPKLRSVDSVQLVAEFLLSCQIFRAR